MLSWDMEDLKNTSFVFNSLSESQTFIQAEKSDEMLPDVPLQGGAEDG